jgi:predicted ATPase
MYAGRFASSRSHLEEVLALYDPIPHRSLVHQAGIHPHIHAQAALGFVMFCLGYPDQALVRSKEAVAEAQSLAQPQTLALSLEIGARVLLLIGYSRASDDWIDRLIAVAAEQSFPFWRALGLIFRGWMDVKNGDVTKGLSLVRCGLSAYRITGSVVWMPHHIGILAAACEITGQIEEASALLEDAEQISERTGDRWYLAELNRRKGQLLLRQGDSEAAEELYRKALSIAEKQEAKLWELRAAVSLARLRRDQGRSMEGYDLLVPVYGWFTEGFDTPDLLEAKALLDELS